MCVCVCVCVCVCACRRCHYRVKSKHLSTPFFTHLWTPLAVNYCLQYYHGARTQTHSHLGPFPTPLCTHAHTLRHGSVQRSRQNIDELINSILPSSCEEVLNLFCFTDLTEGKLSVCVCVCVCFCGMLRVSYVCVSVFSFHFVKLQPQTEFNSPNHP